MRLELAALVDVRTIIPRIELPPKATKQIELSLYGETQRLRALIDGYELRERTGRPGSLYQVLLVKRGVVYGILNARAATDHATVLSVSIQQKVQGKGFGKAMYRHLLHRFGTVWSDIGLSDQALRIYVSLARDGHSVELTSRTMGDRSSCPVVLAGDKLVVDTALLPLRASHQLIVR